MAFISLKAFNNAPKETLIKVIEEARDKFQYDISVDHRFFFVKEFIEIEFKKSTKGGLMGTRYFDVSDMEEYHEEMTSEDIASLLNTKEWD